MSLCETLPTKTRPTFSHLPGAARGRKRRRCGGALACWSFERGSGSRVVNLRVTGSAGPRIDAQHDRALTAFYSRRMISEVPVLRTQGAGDEPLHLSDFGQGERVFDIDPEVTDGAFDLCLSEEDLHVAQIAGCLVDDGSKGHVCFWAASRQSGRLRSASSTA